MRFFTPQRRRLPEKEAVGIVQVADDLLEAAKVFGEFRVQVGLGVEKQGHRRVFDGAHGVRVTAADRQRDNVFVAEHLQSRLRKRLPQEAERGQRQQEIADGPATDDKDFGLGRRRRHAANIPESRRLE